VTLTADERAVTVRVADHGVGLNPGDEMLVFNRFWRGDVSRTRQTGGTGLGLSISQEDARLHGGRIEAQGVPGRGAEFRLVLPLVGGRRLPAGPADEETTTDDSAPVAEAARAEDALPGSRDGGTGTGPGGPGGAGGPGGTESPVLAGPGDGRG